MIADSGQMPIPMLRSLRLTHFKSFDSATIEFGNPTFLVGPNGAGKSNLTDALALLSEAMSSPIPVVFGRRGGFKGIRHRRSQRGRPSNLGLRIDLQDLDEKTPSASYELEFKAIGPHDFEVLREQCIVNRCDGSEDVYDCAYGEFNSNVSSLKPILEPKTLALPLVGGDQRFRPVLQFIRVISIYRINPFVMRELQDPDGGSCLRTDGANITSVIRAIQQGSEIGQEKGSRSDWQNMLGLLETIVPKIVDVSTKRVSNKLKLEFTQESIDSEHIEFEAYNMSDGTLRALGLLAAVFQPKKSSVLVIEEPEVTMHPEALGAVLDLLRHAQLSMQVVVTTHSPDILDAKWIEDDHLRIVSWQNGSSRVDRISEAGREIIQDNFMGAGELLRSNALTAEPAPDPLDESKPRPLEDSTR